MTAMSDLHNMLGEDPFDESKLVPELRETLFDASNGMRFVGHPLVHGVFFSWKVANEALRIKRADLRESMRDSEWERIVWLHERPYRVRAFDWLMRREKLTTNGLRELWLDVWTDTEFPSNTWPDPLEAFRALAFVTDDAAGWAVKPDDLTAYRGLAPWNQSRVDPRVIDPGIAWTLDLDKARWFARRYASSGGGAVLCYDLAKEEALGWIVGRDENEVILDFEEISDAGRVRVLERL